MIGLILALAVAAQNPSAPGVIGPGIETCQRVMKPQLMGRVSDYVWGVWSGMNMAGNTPAVGHSTDKHGIVKEVILVCSSAPKLPLALAILAVHMRFEKTQSLAAQVCKIPIAKQKPRRPEPAGRDRGYPRADVPSPCMMRLKLGRFRTGRFGRRAAKSCRWFSFAGYDRSRSKKQTSGSYVGQRPKQLIQRSYRWFES